MVHFSLQGLLLALSLAWLAAVIVLIARALRQRRVFHEVKGLGAFPGDHPKAAIIVPARNEEQNMGRCLRSLLAQRYPPRRLSIIAIDDNSSDKTAEIIENLAQATGRVQLLRAPPLLPGWTGKSHACWIAAAAAASENEWLCFMDADIDASPALIEAALSHAIREGIEFLSLTPRQTLVTFSERLILPCGFYLLAFSQDLSTVNAPESGAVSATGQFLLIRSGVYRAIGGHEAVLGEICEDVALARLAKQHRFKTALYGGTALYSTRMYTGWRTLWPGITKNLVDMLGGPVSAMLTASVGLALAWAGPLLPAADAIQCSASATGACVALAAALPASLAAFAFHISGAAFFRIPLWYGLIFPAGYTVGAALAADSVRRRLTGQIRWKGRVYG